MKQNTHKNKSCQLLNLPKTTYYTLQDVFSINPQFNGINITIRVRHTKMIEAGKVAEIGSIPGGKGRPQKVFAMTPVTQITLAKARQNNINLVDNSDKLINVINVTTLPARSSTPSVHTPNGCCKAN